MEKHNSLKALLSKVDLLLHNISKLYSLFVDLDMFRKSTIYLRGWQGRYYLYFTTSIINLVQDFKG